MDLAQLSYFIRIVTRNDKAREEWLVAPSLIYCSLVVVEELLHKEYVMYYSQFDDNLCIDKLFE